MIQTLIMIVLFYLCVFKVATCSEDYAFEGKGFLIYIKYILYVCLPIWSWLHFYSHSPALPRLVDGSDHNWHFEGEII